MPLAGSVRVAGFTPEEVAGLVEDKLRGPYLKKPKVSVNIKKSTNQQVVTIDGAVQQPGNYPIVGRMTLQKAIATARGASDTANIHNVVVFRTVSNQKMAALFDLKDIRSGRFPDPLIYGNDVVVVGESAIEKMFRNVRLAFPMFNRFIPYIMQ
jgi:polysaccharide export outer membrane protein